MTNVTLTITRGAAMDMALAVRHAASASLDAGSLGTAVTRYRLAARLFAKLDLLQSAEAADEEANSILVNIERERLERTAT